MKPDEAGIESITLRKVGELTRVIVHLSSGWAAEFEGIAEFDENDEGNSVISIEMILKNGVLLRIFYEQEPNNEGTDTENT